jgi:O-antigen/teichoic acid export membrane protein
VGGLTRLWRLVPFDTSTVEGRAAERHRRALLTAAAAAAARGTSVLVTLISVPLTLHYLGPERYGMWMAISSALAFLTFADLGVGLGLLNEVSRASGSGDLALMRRRISSAMCALCGIAAAAIVAFALAYAHVPWSALFNVQSEDAVREAGPAVAAMFVLFTLGLPTLVVQRVQAALQLGFVANIWQAAAAVVSLIATLVAVAARAPLPYLVLAVAAAPVLTGAANSVWFLFRAKPELRPRLRDVDLESVSVLLRIGFLFLVLQLGVGLAYTSDNFIIARVLGAQAVSDYAVPAKLFALVSIVLRFVLDPLWPAYSEAFVRGDRGWVLQTFRRTTRLALTISSALSLMLLACSPWLLDLWVGSAIRPSGLLLCALALWAVLETWGHAVAAFLNGLGILRMQVILGTVFAVVCFAARYFAIGHAGVAGIPIATAVAFGVLVILPYAVLIPRLIARL